MEYTYIENLVAIVAILYCGEQTVSNYPNFHTSLFIPLYWTNENSSSGNTSVH